MIELQESSLVFSFPEVHQAAKLVINFQRTLRIPDDNQRYPLPAGLGPFPLHHVDDFSGKVPESWQQHGGIFLPMYQSEALWINFGGGSFGSSGYPFAVKVAAGKINAVTGEQWLDQLDGSPQDYAVVPGQPWLDGYCVQEGLIRQFVAMPLGQGYTAEEQLTGVAEYGGLQLIAYPMKRERYKELQAQRELERRSYDSKDAVNFCLPDSNEMGLAPGGLMEQDIYSDEYGLDAWDTAASSRCFVHIANSESYRAITGVRPPTQPISERQYVQCGIPWFEYYGGDAKALKGASILARLDSLMAKAFKSGAKPAEAGTSIKPKGVVKVGERKQQVREGRV